MAKRACCLLRLVVLAASVVVVTPAWAQICGGDLQTPCKVTVAKDCFACWGSVCAPCYEKVDRCNIADSIVNRGGLCQSYTRTTIRVPTAVNFLDSGNRVTLGYQTNVDLNHAWVIIPNQNIPSTCQLSSYKAPLQRVIPDPVVPAAAVWITDPNYDVTLAVNANFFDVRMGPLDTEPCTNIMGYTVSNKQLMRSEEKITLFSMDGPPRVYQPATLVFYTDEYARQTGRQAAIKQYPFLSNPNSVPPELQNAVSGTPLVTAGSYVGDSLAGPDPSCRLARSAVGISADGNTLYVVVVNPGDHGTCRVPVQGTSLAGLANYIISLGASDAINLDGGGSAQLYFQQSGVKVKTLPADTIRWYNEKVYRPVGNFLGFR